MPKCEKCNKKGCYGTKTNPSKRCKDHRLLSDYYTKNKFCEVEECILRANYGIPGSPPRFCGEHKGDDDMDLHHKMCEYKGCFTRAGFKDKETGKLKYCKEHAPSGSISNSFSHYHFPGCKIRKLFGKPNTDIPEFCKGHAPLGYINIKKRKCECPTCEITACFRLPEEIRYRWCKQHCPNNAVSMGKLCLYCVKRATFCDPDSKEKKYCKDHRLNDSISTDKRKCDYIGCQKQPSYGLREDLESKKATRCSEHQQPGMIDVIHRKCNFENCPINPTYGYPGYSMERCATHRLPRMVMLSKQQPKEEEKTCEYCRADIQYYEEFCKGCKKFVVEKVTTETRIKEFRIKKVLTDNDIEFVHDRQIDNSVSKRRPDFLIETSWGYVIVEVDEFQHKKKSYPEECECTRMLQIYNELAYNNLTGFTDESDEKVAVIFVRYNPDNYKPFTATKKFSKECREKYLCDFISALVNVEPEDNLVMFQLFYDGFDPDNPNYFYVQNV